jgi:biopolymer transport protein TolR
MRARRLKNEINVVPYIDVMLVLLVIFMVTAPMMQTSTINVPNAGQSSVSPAEKEALVIGVDDKRIWIDDSSSGDESKRSLTRDELKTVIQSELAKNPDRPIAIAGDMNTQYKQVVDVINEAHKAGAKKVGLLTKTGS